MNRIPACKAHLSILPVLFFLLTLAGCSDSLSTPPTTVHGVAAAGAPIIGTVTIRSADVDDPSTTDVIENQAQAVIEQDGSFSVSVTGLTPPYLLWAEGQANGKAQLLYSVATGIGRTNIHPISHLVTGLLAGTNPSESIQASAITASAILQAELDAKTMLDDTFAAFGLTTSIDLLSSNLTADGTGLDEIFDLIDINLAGITVTITDRGSGTDLFLKAGASTPTTDLDSLTIVNTIQSSRDALTTLKALASRIEGLFGGSGTRPSAAVVEQRLDALYSTNTFLEDGRYLFSDAQSPPNVNFEKYWSSAAGPDMGTEVESVAILRHMKRGSVAGVSYDEDGDGEGIWGVMRMRSPKEVRDVVVALFLENDEWKWGGNQNPFTTTPEILPEAVWIDPVSGSTSPRLTTGLGLFFDDGTERLAETHAIDRVYVINDALPQHGNGRYLILDPDGTDALSNWKIRTGGSTGSISGGAVQWGRRFLETTGGLDRSLLTDRDFQCIAVTSTGTVVRTWPVLLPGKPAPQSDLDALNSANALGAMFSTIRRINGTSTTDLRLADLDVDFRSTIEWTYPPLSYVESVSFYRSTNTVEPGSDNSVTETSPFELDQARAWLSHTLTYENTGTPTHAAYQVVTIGPSGRRFVTHRPID